MSAGRVSPTVVIKSAGEMASAVAWRLYMANIRRLVMLDLRDPLCVRRTVSFCEALAEGSAVVEGIEATAARDLATIEAAWAAGRIPVTTVDLWAGCAHAPPDVVVDAILAKRNLGTSRDEAALVIALGPGFEAGVDCHFVIETNRGHDLGRIISTGAAQANTGIPGEIGGYTAERVLRAPGPGIFTARHAIGDTIDKGAVVGDVDGYPVATEVAGVLRGLIRSGVMVQPGLKLGDVDPRCRREHCWTISDKARAIAGAVLEATMRHFNRPACPC